MPPPSVIEVTIQKDANDCAAAALAMITGRPYRDVAAAARRASINLWAGLYPSDIQKLAKALRCPLTRRRRATYDDDSTGVVLVRRIKTGDLHAVAMFQGCVIDPSDGLIYDRDVFFAQGWSPCAFLEAT